MTHRQRFFAVVEGPAPTPAFFPDISDWYVGARTRPGQPRPGGAGAFIPDDSPIHRDYDGLPARYAGWTYLDFYRRFDWGLPVHVYDWFETRYDGVEHAVRHEGNRRITTLRCAKGALEKVDTLAADGSWCPTSRYVKGLRDLELVRHVVERTRFLPRYQRVRQVLLAEPERTVCDVPLMRSPFGKLIHEYMGFEQVVYALHDEERAILDFLDFQEEYDLKLVHLAAGAPARVVILSDHADENLIAPPLYRRFCLPHYHKATGILHAAGKLVSTHLDGNIRGYLPFLHQTGFDLLDGCTPAPMTNYEVEELARALKATWAAAPAPGMTCYCGVPATLLCTGRDDGSVAAFGRRIVEAFDGRVILNVGDILPPNGRIEQVAALGQLAAGYR